jgi:hypothetical protein
MSRIVAMLLVVVLLVASVPSAAHAGGHGPGRLTLTAESP